MAGLFIGEHVHKVDSKGRVSVPSDFRAVIAASDPNYRPEAEKAVLNLTFTVGRTDKMLLEGWTQSGHTKLITKIMANKDTATRTKLLARFSGRAVKAAIDETGRLVLPAKLRNQCQISDQAVFIGMGATFELMNPETAARKDAEIDAFDDDLGTGVDPLTTLGDAFSMEDLL